MFTSIATVSLSGDLDEKLRAVAAAGFDGVEIFEADFLTFDGGPKDVGAMIRDLGLRCVAFQPFRDFEGMPEPQRSRLFARAERKFEVMAELGTDLLMVCSNVSPLSLGGIDRAADDFRELGERAAAHGFRVGFEALAWGRHINDHRDAWEVVRRADHPAVGVVFDSYHTLARKLPVDSIRAVPGDRIALVQIADAPSAEMDLLSLSRHFRCMPGQGALPVADFVAAVQATGYDGAYSLEIFNDQFRAGTTKSVAIDGKRSFVALSDRLSTEEPGRPPEADRIAAERIEFVEFSVDAETADDLASLFQALGFRRLGTHRTKAVTAWRQGSINLVINTEADGFAHAHAIVHGPSICAVGLRVDDAALVMARAARLRFQGFDGPVGPGEVEMPAVRGVGGSLLYFLEPQGPLADVWSIDFELETANDDKTGAGLTTIDHIAQVMGYGEMLSWRLAYTALLELDPAAEVDLVDPGGLVQSQALQSPNGAMRIVLNSSRASRTMSSRFISEYFGSGTQHIAFQTDDILATVEAMRARGLEMIEIPDNYYDDLETRTDLDDATLARLREHHVLYDRDEAGEYFQFYTRAFADRFFFEVVQRRGYAGYGAANAPVRIAAQSREASRENALAAELDR